ncbi:hypothetical protein EN836_07320 [Mesorhizobium sp. M1C.F.Ca.ET.193.01.1.1]|uniref:hypothetical protein n=1 Tax=unclassified Mesorhizobium TaxID=325217 RepID=UPI000FD2E669|nr:MULTISPECIES: hypothetical protein [unclassified Mesorhizobium]TGT02523.1 hypothetical protein EN820_25780 [bacterium M00.F.Ca.ET.177.01.1.1]RWJ96517.1 MAG: hypothetical protein EOR42_30210 [Mesorhizobium sp.]RWK17539.1 MAG: hypothetical protein EOR43_27600 [Mesorhizobium sp.]RWK26086.1 MAG: hypothetical protein EOR44_31970 [Mesorhizobium sp.]TGQ55209.1 hypothetical protein EN853_08255 [Mesorhizobium sp. M1C.F.Ca.ET.210.01.1.1]
MPATAAAVDQYKIASFKDIPQTLATQIDYPGADRWADGSVGDVCWIESTHRSRLTKSLLPVKRSLIFTLSIIPRSDATSLEGDMKKRLGHMAAGPPVVGR